MGDYGCRHSEDLIAAASTQSFFVFLLPPGVTGDVQLPDMFANHELKTKYRSKQSEWEAKQLTEHGQVKALGDRTKSTGRQIAGRKC